MDQQTIDAIRTKLKVYEVISIWKDYEFPKLPYYEYFNHPNLEAQRYSVAVYFIRLGSWETGYYFSFYGKQPELEMYIQSFLENSETIKGNFPVMYQHILYYSNELLNGSPGRGPYWKFRMAYPLKKALRLEIENNLNFDLSQSTMDDILNELQIEPYRE